MPNTTITNNGLAAAIQASDTGPLIAVKYFVPIYDPRIDGLIHDNIIPVSAFSACVNVSAIAPEGEIIWNINPNLNIYSLSDINTSFIISGTNTASANSGADIVNPIQSQKWQINELDEVPLSPHFSATNAAFVPSSKTWHTSAVFSPVIGNGNTSPESGRAKYFQVVDYFPVSADELDTKLRGMIKCSFSKNIGTIKFNKIALYITSFNSSGVESSDEPVFFAECQLKSTIVKTNVATNGFDDITIDVQLGLHSLSATWNDVFYSTSGDYWSRVPGGLYYSEKIGIGSFIDSILEPQAALHVRRTRAMVNDAILDAPVARFDFDDFNYHQKDIDNNGIIHDTYNSSTEEFGIYYSPASGAFYPDVDGTVAIGQQYDRFNGLYLNEIGLNISVKSPIPVPDSSYYKIHYERYGMGGFIETTDDTVMNFNVISAGGASPAVAQIARIKGADICREKESLLNYTVKTDSNEPDVYIMAGVDSSFSGWSLAGTTGQNGVTHKNILWYLTNQPDNINWLSPGAKVHIHGGTRIDLRGPVMFDSANALDIASGMTGRTRLLLAAGLSSSLTPTTFNTYVNNATTDAQWKTLISDFIADDAEIDLLGTIRHSGDIIPLISSTYSSAAGSTLGQAYAYDLTPHTTPRLAFKRLFIDTIGAYDGETHDSKAGWQYADNRVNVIYASQIGTTAGPQARVNSIALNEILNQTYVDIGTINNANDSLYTGTPYYGLWPKRYINIGNLTDTLNTVGHGTTDQTLYQDSASPESSGKTILDIYSQNYSVTNQISFEDAFTIKGLYRGINPTISKANYISDANTYWPGIHPNNAAVRVTLGDSLNNIYSAFIVNGYITNLQANIMTALTSITTPTLNATDINTNTLTLTDLTASTIEASTSIQGGKILGKLGTFADPTHPDANSYVISVENGNFVDVTNDLSTYHYLTHIAISNWTAGSIIILRNTSTTDLRITLENASYAYITPVGYAAIKNNQENSSNSYIYLKGKKPTSGSLTSLYTHIILMYDGVYFVPIAYDLKKDT